MESSHAIELVELHALLTIAKWGDSVEPSEASLNCSRDLHKSAGLVPHQILIRQCPRLRLLALFAKILSLFNSSQANHVADEVNKWNTFISYCAAFGSRSVDWEATLRTVRDKCVSPNDSAFDLAASTTLIRAEFIRSVQFISSCTISTESLPAQSSGKLPESFISESRAEKKTTGFGGDLPQPSNSKHDNDNCVANEVLEVSSQPDSPPSSSQRSHANAWRTPQPTERVVERPEDLATQMSMEHQVPAAAVRSSSSKFISQEQQTTALETRTSSLMSYAASDAENKKRKFVDDRRTALYEQGVHGQRRACLQTVRSTAPHSFSKPSLLEEKMPPQPRQFMAWSEEEENRLIRGHTLYGNSWETIRKSCSLRHRLGTQLKDKWRNLERSGQV